MLLVAGTAVQAADFNDSNYHEYILYDVDTPFIDVLIIPPASPYPVRDMTVIKDGIIAWDDGINNLGPSWLANGVEIRTYIVGFDVIPEEALMDPEIIVVSSEHDPVLLFGVGLQSPLIWCHNIGPGGGQVDWREELVDSPDFHQHESAWGMVQVACDDGGRQCYVVNTNFLWLPDAENRRQMYDLNTHEIGHCLGIGHVGDALDFSAANYPAEDIMSYQHGSHVHCVSTLNIKALEAVYDELLGQPGAVASAGTYVDMDPADYATDTCAEPTVGWP